MGLPPCGEVAIIQKSSGRIISLNPPKTDEPVPPSRLVPAVPRDAETIVLKCLQKDAARRYPAAEALAEDLRRFLEDRPIRARRVSSAERLLRWGRRNKLVAGLLAGLLVTLVAGFVVSTTQWIRAEANAARADANAAREAGLSAKYARELYTSDMFAIQQAWEAGNVIEMEKLLLRHIPSEAGQDDWRGFEWDVFWRHHQRAQSIRTFPISDVLWRMAATPDGQTLAALVHVHAPDPADE